MKSDAIDMNPPAAAESLAAIPYADASVPTARQTVLTSGITRGDIATLAVRVFGIYLLLQALPLVLYLFSAMYRVSGSWLSRAGQVVYFYAAYGVAIAGAGAFLVVKAPRVAAWLLPRSTANPDLPPAPGAWHGLQSVAVSIVGLYLAASAFPDLAASFARYASADRDMLPALIKSGVEFIAGLILFFRAKRISAYWQRLGMPRPASTENDSGPL
jgi:hypothetical protein